jgi:hypothetical protein
MPEEDGFTLKEIRVGDSTSSVERRMFRENLEAALAALGGEAPAGGASDKAAGVGVARKKASAKRASKKKPSREKTSGKKTSGKKTSGKKT